MAGCRSSRLVTVTNPQGLHARPADMFVRLAMQFESNALDLYLKITDREEFAPVKDVLEGVIGDEKAHLKRLGELLEREVSRDQSS